MGTQTKKLPPADAPGWVAVTLPLDKATTKRLVRARYIWFTREIRLPEGAPAELRHRRYGVAVVANMWALELYADGVRFGTVGRMPPDSPWLPLMQPRAFAVPSTASEDGRSTLTICAWTDSRGRLLAIPPIGAEPFRLGPLDRIRATAQGRAQWLRGMHEMRLTFLLVLAAAFAVVFLWLFVRRRELTELLPFSLMCLSLTGISVVSLLAVRGTLSLTVAPRILHPFMLLYHITLPEFLSRLLSRRAPGWALRTFQVYALALGAGVFLIDFHALGPIVLVAERVGAAGLVGVGIWVAVLAFRGNREARTISLGVVVLVATILLTYFRGPAATPVIWIGFLALMAAMAASVAQRFVQSRDELDASHRAAVRFVPSIFLETLGKKRLHDVGYGDAKQQRMTVLFSDIRGFTTLSERLGAEETFALLMSGETRAALADPHAWHLREVDRVQAKGKDEPVTLWEVLDALPPEQRDARLATAEPFAQGVVAYRRGDFAKAGALFARCADEVPSDGVVQELRNRCAELQAAPPEDWKGVTRLNRK